MKLPKPKLVRVETPEWADAEPSMPHVWVKDMGGAARMAFQIENNAILNGEEDPMKAGGVLLASNLHARLLVRCLTDENGRNLFTREQADELGEQPLDLLQRLYGIAGPLNGMGEEGHADAEKK